MHAVARRHYFARRTFPTPRIYQRVREPHRFVTHCEWCWGTGAAWPRTDDDDMPDWSGEPTGVCERCNGIGIESATVRVEE
jgi:hypothetical protein